MRDTKIHEVLPELPAADGLSSDAEIIDRIRVRAFELYIGRGCVDGFDLEDWFRAEREIKAA